MTGDDRHASNDLRDTSVRRVVPPPKEVRRLSTRMEGASGSRRIGIRSRMAAADRGTGSWE